MVGDLAPPYGTRVGYSGCGGGKGRVGTGCKSGRVPNAYCYSRQDGLGISGCFLVVATTDRRGPSGESRRVSGAAFSEDPATLGTRGRGACSSSSSAGSCRVLA